MQRKGFTLIELMIVVVIVGLLAALAIPRFAKAAKKTKVSEARQVLKQIYIACNAYYEANGQFPAEHTFNDATTLASSGIWNPINDLGVGAPSGNPRFSYRITTGGTDGLVISADPSDSYDQAIQDVTVLTIDKIGRIEGGEF